jgi:hypothetical protein
MNDRDPITKADLDAALSEFKRELLMAELVEEIRITEANLTAQLHQMEANLIAAFRSYD